MRFTLSLLLVAAVFGLSGCGVLRESQPADLRNVDTQSAKPVQASRAETFVDSTQQTVPLNQADAANTAAQAFARKIIRNANLTIEVASPTESQRKIVSIAESHQGFVVTSESTQRFGEDKTKPEITVHLVVRVPAAQFNQAMEEIRAVGMRVTQEKVTGQDVTEEFIDLEARINNQKALEAQFIEIMKRAAKVQDALEVQKELATVRTEIERLQGRRRFLENQASLSTISVTLQPPTQIVSAAGFWFSVKSAFSDGFDVAVGIILFLVRAVIALLPILVLIVLPLVLISRFLIKRFWRRRAGRAKEAEPKSF